MDNVTNEMYNAFQLQFEKTRQERNTEIYTYILKLRTVGELSELMVLALSMRQRLLEDSHYLMIMSNDLQNKLREIKNSLFNDINNNLQTRIRNLSEKNIMVEGNQRYINVKSLMDLFEIQISFFTDSIKTVDNILFGIKNRMELDKLLGI